MDRIVVEDAVLKIAMGRDMEQAAFFFCPVRGAVRALLSQRKGAALCAWKPWQRRGVDAGR